MDKEEQKILEKKEKKEIDKIMQENDELVLMIKSKGWKIAKKKLFEKIIELSDILVYDEKDAHKLMIEIGANQQAIKILLEWIDEIEGEVSKYNSYKNMYKEIQEEKYLKYFEDEY